MASNGQTEREEPESLTDMTARLASIELDLRDREEALEARFIEFRALEASRTNMDDYTAIMQEVVIPASEERDSDTSFRRFTSRDATDVSHRQPLQSTILEENSQNTPGRNAQTTSGGNPQPAQRERSREPNHVVTHEFLLLEDKRQYIAN